MYEKTIYVANDGTEFKNDRDCIQYERKQIIKKVVGDLKLYDEGKKEIPVTEISKQSWLESIYYAFINTKDAALVFHNLSLDCGLESPWNNEEEACPGFYYYDCGWSSVEKQIESLNSILALANKKIKVEVADAE